MMHRQMMKYFRVLGLTVGIALQACSAPIVKAPDEITPEGDHWLPRPDVTALQSADFPEPVQLVVRHKDELATGVALRVVPRRQAPTVFLRWVLPGGRAHEFAQVPASGPTPKHAVKPLVARWPEGTLQLTGEMLIMGTKSHPDTLFAAELGKHGAQFSATVLPDGVVLEVQVLSHQLLPTLRLVQEALVEANFDKAALENLRQRHRAELQTETADPAAFAARLSRKLTFGEGSAYGSSGLNIDTLGKIERKHLLEAHKVLFALGNSQLVAVGDVDAKELSAMLLSVFGASLDTVSPPPPPIAPQMEVAENCHVIAVADAVQTAIVSTNLAPPRQFIDWTALLVANQVLGGSASSRLFAELREKRGLTYGIYSKFEGRRLAGKWELGTQVRSEVTGAALGAIAQQIEQIHGELIPAAELLAAQRYLTGQHALSLASAESIADLLASVALYELPTATYPHFVEDIMAVTPEKAQAVAKQWIAAGPRTTVLIGQLAAVRPAIDAFCTRIVQRDANGKVTQVLVGADVEMNDAARFSAFESWPKSPDGLVAVQRYVAQAERSPAHRAQALAFLAASPAHARTLGFGRKAADWLQVAAVLRGLLIARLVPTGGESAAFVRSVLLDMATAKTTDGHLLDADDAGATEIQKAVADWAFAGMSAATPAADVRLQGAERLADGDLVRLGAEVPDALEHWIAADFRRHEAARALINARTPAALSALLQGYRRLFGGGAKANSEDLELITSHQSPEMLLLLLDVHGWNEASIDASAKTTQTLCMKSIREQIAKLAGHTGADGGRSDLALIFGKLETHLDALLAMQNADDRWYAAQLLIKYRGLTGLRRVLTLMAQDDNYRSPLHHTVDPKRAVGELARDFIAPLGVADVQPLMFAALQANHVVGKVIAVTVLKVFADEASLAALNTHNDDADAAPILDLAAFVSVHDLAIAAVDVVKYQREIDAAVRAGKLTQAEGAVYSEIAFFTYDLTGARLRADVVARARDKLPARSEPTPKEPEAQPAPLPIAPTKAAPDDDEEEPVQAAPKAAAPPVKPK